MSEPASVAAQRVRVTGAGSQHQRQPPPEGAEIDEQTVLGECADGLLAARPAAPGVASPCVRSSSLRSACRWCSTLRPALAEVRVLGVPAGVGRARLARLPTAVRCSAGRSSAGQSATNATSPTSSDAERRAGVAMNSAAERGRCAARDRGDPRDRHLGLRFSRTTSDFFVASRRSARPSTPARSAASTSPRRRSSESPGWCSPSAPTCCGIRSAGRPATSSSSSWSPRRCVARAPTRCPTSPRPGWAPGGSGPSPRCWWWRSAGSTCCRSSRAPVSPWRPPWAHRSWVGAVSVAVVVLRQRASAAACAASPSSRPSSTGSSSLPCWCPPSCCSRSGWATARRARRPREPTRRSGRCPLAEGGAQGLYITYSLIIATFLGTMGLPHVVVRFYTNPDGRAARRTTLVVLALLGGFYLLPPVYAALGRIYARPELGPTYSSWSCPSRWCPASAESSSPRW